MKYIFFVLLFIVGNFFFAQSQSNNNMRPGDTSRIPTPKIYLVYFKNGTPFDRDLSRITNKPLKDEMMQEAGRRVKEFQSLWDQEGANYLQIAFAEVGLPFPYVEMQAALTVSPVASTSAPLIINVKSFLSSAEKPAPLSVFPIILFHELMHTYLRGIGDSSLFRKKYASESFVTFNHLHLMALEKFVLLKLGKTEILSWLDNDYRTVLPPGYKRAWEIVNDIEDYETFIKDLKLMAVKKVK